LTRAEYLRARGWFRFVGADGWYRQERMDGTTEEAAIEIELDVVETGLRLLEERKRGGVVGVAELSAVAEPPAADDVDREVGQ